MKYIIYIILASSMLILGNTSYQPISKARVLDICDLQGAVYVEEVAAFAKYRVFVEDIENFADFVVFKEDNEAFANEPGHWYFTDVRGFADFTIYLEEVKGFADFSIAYTEFRTTAGCK